LETAARITWKRRGLWVLGVVFAALTSGELFSRLVEGPLFEFLSRIPQLADNPIWSQMPRGLISLKQVGDAFAVINGLGTVGWVGFFRGLVIGWVAVGLASVVLLGALIAAGSGLPDQPILTLRAALLTGWKRIWPMIIVASVPAIPLTLGAII